MENDSLSIRLEALKSLSRYKPKDINIRLIELLLDTKSDVLSAPDQNILQSQYRNKIIEFGDSSMFPIIKAYLNYDVKLEIRKILIEFYRVFGDASVIPNLIDYLNEGCLRDISR